MHKVMFGQKSANFENLFFWPPGQGGLWEGGKAVAILSDLAKRVSSTIL